VANNSYNSEEKSDSKRSGKVIAEALERFKLTEEAESDIRRRALEDLQFRSGEQWPTEVKASRSLDGRPCLVINRIPQFINQITNDQRQNRPAIRVHPVDSMGDVGTGKTIQGLIRHIEYNSNADVAYDTAFESAVTGGFGYFRVVTDFVDPEGFDQEILIKRVRNPFSVFYDPYASEPDGSDANFAFIVDDLSADEYKMKYPDSDLASGDIWEATGNTAPDWVGEKFARVAEYFYKETKEVELLLLSDGAVIEKGKLDEYAQKVLAEQGPIDITIVKERVSQVPVVKWCKINGCEILEETTWPGKYIPIIPVYGSELYIEGKKTLEGIVRNAMDSQRMYNYWASAETEAIALAPRTPFIVAEGQIEGYEQEWRTANTRNHSYLPYKPTTLDGNPSPPPQRNSFEPAVQAITQARMLASEDLKSTTGIYDASLGAQSNETSGIAIQRRNVQAQTSNFHFIDNLTRSLRHAGRVLVDLIPKIYDTERAARIIGDDGEQKIVTVNGPTEDNGKPVLYQLDAGKYDVTIDAGPSFASKRQEASQSMLELSKSAPALMSVAPDLIVKNLDFQGAQELAERLKKTVPPELLEDKDGGGKGEVPPEMQAQMEQMTKMVEGLTEQLNDAQNKIDNKTIELESKERIEMKKLEVELEIQSAKLDAQNSLSILSSEINQINERMSYLRPDEQFQMEEQEPPQEQDLQSPMDGGQPAEPIGVEQEPTGGESPGQSMEEEFIP